MAAYDVRPARPADAERLGVVHVQAWREAYATLMPAAHLAGLDAVARGRRWAELLADGRTVLVGTADDEVVGFATCGPSRDDPPDPALELTAIYLLAVQHGSDLGRRLLDAALDGGGAASLWVATGNDRATAFYAKHGFAPDGQVKAHAATGITEERWVRPAG